MKLDPDLKSALRENKKRLIGVFAAAFVSALVSAVVYTTVVRLCFGVSLSASVFYSADSLVRMLFFFLLYSFVLSCVFFDRRKIFDFIFKNRWYVALGVFVLLVLLKINFSSVGAFDYFVQPDMKTDETLPIFGVARSIRSDEWLVYVPRAFTSDFEGFDKYNYIIRAAENYSISANGLKLGWAALSSPMSWGYYLFGAEYGLSFYWSFLMVLTFMASYEFSLVIGRGNRRVALFGAAFLGLSQFTMWWSVCTYLISAQLLIVTAYYFFGEKKLWRKIVFATGAAFSATLFVVKLYPAWQVPYGYILIGLIVWLVITKFGEIRALRWYDVLMIALAFLLMVSLVGAYLLETSEANKALLATDYPGKRFETGGMGINKTGAFLHTLMMPFKEITAGNNNSDASMFFSLFPLPMIFSVYTLVRQIIRKRCDPEQKIDVFNVAVLIPSLFLLIYASVGFPAWLAKYSLMSYSMAVRVADMLGLANTYLLIRHLSSEEDRVSFKIAAPAVALSAVFWVWSSVTAVPGYMPVLYIIAAVMLAAGLALTVYSKPPEKVKAVSVVSFTALIAVLGLCVHPVMRGADALVEKPFALAVRAEVEKDGDARWIGYGNHVVGQYLIANGAPTINSVNYIPNLEFWHRFFDAEDVETRKIYNRYAHVSIEFSSEETDVELVQPDYVRLVLNFADVKTADIDYVASITGKVEVEENPYFELEEVYAESNAYIYRVIYK